MPFIVQSGGTHPAGDGVCPRVIARKWKLTLPLIFVCVSVCASQFSFFHSPLLYPLSPPLSILSLPPSLSRTRSLLLTHTLTQTRTGPPSLLPLCPRWCSPLPSFFRGASWETDKCPRVKSSCRQEEHMSFLVSARTSFAVYEPLHYRLGMCLFHLASSWHLDSRGVTSIVHRPVMCVCVCYKGLWVTLFPS